jgi:hypothetical protein
VTLSSVTLSDAGGDDTMMPMVRTRTSFIEEAAPARLLAIIVAGTCLLCAGSARAQTLESSRAVTDEPIGSPQPIPAPDYLFAPAGTFSITLASGIPLLGIGELTYSPTDRFAMGAVVAGTPDLPRVQGTAAIGLRPRGVVLVEGSWRSVLVVPILSYPKVPGFGDRDPWILARPTLTLEKTFVSGVRLSVGVGLIAAACTESLFTLGQEHTMMGGVWNTASFGGAVPISARTSLFGEASLIMRGVVPANDWIGGAPIVALVGIATSL